MENQLPRLFLVWTAHCIIIALLPASSAIIWVESLLVTELERAAWRWIQIQEVPEPSEGQGQGSTFQT
jgi:hypothetical protein